MEAVMVIINQYYVKMTTYLTNIVYFFLIKVSQ